MQGLSVRLLPLILALLVVGCGEGANFSSAKAPVRKTKDLNNGDATAKDPPPVAGGETTPVVVVDAGGPDQTGTDGTDDDPTDTSTDPGDVDETIITKTFDAGVTSPVEMQAEVNRNSVSVELTQTKSYEERPFSKTQNIRTPKTKDWTQGEPAEFYTDRLTGDAFGILDVLVVFDNSGSMKGEQTALKDNLPALLSAVNGSDWRVAIVSTDPGNANTIAKNTLGTRRIVPTTASGVGCLAAVINKSEHVADPADPTALTPAEIKFRDTIVGLGLKGTGTEQGVRMAIEGLGCEYETGKNFLRPNSTIAVLIVSDEDNCSQGHCGPANDKKDWDEATNATYDGFNSGTGLSLVRYLESLRTDLTQTAVYGLIAQSDNECQSDEHPEYKGLTYMNVVELTGGSHATVCGNANNYQTTLTAISNNVKNNLKKSFTLTHLPVPGTVVVKTGPAGTTDAQLTERLDAHYVVAGKVVTFTAGNEPAEGDKILITYEKTASSLVKDFALTEQPAPGTLNVYVGTDLVAANAYSLVAETVDNVTSYIIRFNEYPAATSTILASYRENTPLLNSFMIDSAIKPGSVTVKVNDVATTDFTVNNSGELSFATVPPDGATITGTFEKDLGPVLTYPIMLVGTNQRGYKITSKATGDEVEGTVENGVVTFTAANHSNRRVLVVTYYNSESYNTTVTLQKEPDPDSLEIMAGTSVCELGEGAELSGLELTITCDFEDNQNLKVKYTHTTPVKTFVVPEVPLGRTGVWTVKIDGQPTTEFTATGNVITVNDEIGASEKVEITWTGKL